MESHPTPRDPAGSRCTRGLPRWWGLAVAAFLWAILIPSAAQVPSAGSVQLGPSHAPGFSLMPGTTTGIRFQNRVPESRHLTNAILLNGSGVAAGDIDGDGRCDLYFCHLNGTNALYRNLGDWRFEEITTASGVGCEGLTSTGAVLSDLDGDGDLDLVVNTVGQGTRLFWNDGRGRFEAGAVVNPRVAGTTAAVADVDGDGLLDLYIANHRTSSLMDFATAFFTFRNVNGRNEVDTVNGRPVTDPGLADRFIPDGRGSIYELGETDLLLRNRGGRQFEPVSFTGGAFLDEGGAPLKQAPRGWGLCAAFHDINGDGLPDLYVCHDFQTEDLCWINQGNGVFRSLPRLALRRQPISSMAVDFADINLDGFTDFLVIDMLRRGHRERMMFVPEPPPIVHTPGLVLNRPQYQMNTLFLNRGDTTFSEIAQLSGLDAADWAWSCVFLDVDLDGWQDVLVVNGMERAGRDLDIAEQIARMRKNRRPTDAEIFQARRMFPRLSTPNLAFRNQRDLTFAEVGQQWGFAQKGVTTAMATADLDNDGDLDVVVSNFNDPAGVYRNEGTAPRVGVRLVGRAPNTRGIGARIRVLGGAVPEQSQEMISGGRYLSGDDSIRSFAAGSLTNRLTVEVTWRNGSRTTVSGIEPNRICEIREADAQPAPGPLAPQGSTNTWFVDVSSRIGHRHPQPEFDDFSRQPLLPNRLSQLGPGVAWFDVDGDSREDLIVGTGAGGSIRWFRSDGRGGFEAGAAMPGLGGIAQDTSTILGWTPPSGPAELLVGLANYVGGPNTGVSVRGVDLKAGTASTVLGATPASTGPLALADWDGAGGFRLFVGGRVIAGRYPEPADSQMLRWTAGRWEIDVTNSAALKGLGLATGAVFSDLDGDGLPDLVVACEWGPIRVFRNDQGLLRDVTAAWGLERHRGWWTGVTTGDFDGDGRLDIVAGNWGRNTRYQAFRERPLRLHHGTFSGGPGVDVLESHWDAQLQREVPDRQLNALAKGMPFLRERFATHRAFSQASVEDLLGSRTNAAAVLEANWLESTVFLNRGGRFEAVALPIEAQMSAAFGVCVGDADGDGVEDLFLSQNFFGAQPETPRLDGGRGLWLRGDGRGGFRGVEGQVSGIRVPGEQRGAALADFDEDGRVDLAVAQNGGPTMLFRNQSARPGLRVRLEGPPSNRGGIGAQVALVYPDGRGPVREVHAGSGYWSEDALTLVLGTRGTPKAIWVRWPGGHVTETPLDPGIGSTTVRVSR